MSLQSTLTMLDTDASEITKYVQDAQYILRGARTLVDSQMEQSPADAEALIAEIAKYQTAVVRGNDALNFIQNVRNAYAALIADDFPNLATLEVSAAALATLQAHLARETQANAAAIAELQAKLASEVNAVSHFHALVEATGGVIKVEDV